MPRKAIELRCRSGALATIAGLTATTDNFIVSVASAWASRTPAQVRTTLGLTVGTDVQAYDSGLAALAAFNTNGILVQTANNTFAGRTLTGTAAQITVTNGDGVSGNPTLSLPSDVLIPTVLTVPNTGLHLLDTNASHDLIIKPGSDISADRTLTITTGDADRTLTISASATVSQDYSTTGNPQFATIELGAASDTTLSRPSAGKLAVEGHTVATLDEQNQALSGGATVTSLALNGGSAVTTGTLTLDLGDCPLQHYTNGGAHTLAPGSVNSSALVDITNNVSAGAITTSGWTKVAGSSFTTTNGHKFRCHCSVGNGGSLLIVQALQ